MKKNYLLPLKKLSLEIGIDIAASAQYTQKFRHHGPDFLFAVAEVTAVTRGRAYLIYPNFIPGNFLEDMSAIAKAVANPPSIKNLEEIIDCGGWCSWMAGYWDRLEAESLDENDETNYEKLIKFSMLESRVGHLAIYKYKESPVIEIASRSSDLGGRFFAWEAFDSTSFGGLIDGVVGDIKNDIRIALDQ